MNKAIAMMAAGLLITSPIQAGESDFTRGPVLREFGPVADVETDFPIPGNAKFRHAFDLSTPAAPGELNRTLVSAARFINMHVRAGVPLERIALAVVVHGGAVQDVSAAREGNEDDTADNLGAALVAALIARGTRIVVCGQSAAYYDIAEDDLLPGVEMALSAMTAHALLQQQGYTLNPF